MWGIYGSTLFKPPFCSHGFKQERDIVFAPEESGCLAEESRMCLPAEDTGGFGLGFAVGVDQVS